MKQANSAMEKINGAGLKIGVAVARFNAAITKKMLAACLSELKKCGVKESHIFIVQVPGALEIPFALTRFARVGDALPIRGGDLKNQINAAVALGCVIRGDTYHFDIVANESARGIMAVQFQIGVPVANGILTAENESQAQARIAKGAEAANAALQMAMMRPLSADKFRKLSQ